MCFFLLSPTNQHRRVTKMNNEQTTEQRRLQIVKLDPTEVLKSHTFYEPVHFWRWINSTTIGVVTRKAVFHWSMEEGSSPERMFSLNFAASQVRSMRDG